MATAYADFEADKAAAASINFCSLWGTAKPILEQLSTVITNFFVKAAIKTVIAAGDAYCGTGVSLSAPSTLRLANAGLKGLDNLSSDQIEALEGMSDADLAAIAKYQSEIDAKQISADVGSGLF